MIYTLTLNPALDYFVSLDNLNLGEINIAKDTSFHCGGKGINVSVLLHELDIDNVALGFLAGETGKIFEELLDRENHLVSDFIYLNSGKTRINVKINEMIETEINGEGIVITDDDFQQLLKKLDCLIKDDILILSGSIPKQSSKNIYTDIIKYLSNRGIKIVLDTSSETLLNSLKYAPFLIKPNKKELETIFQTEITDIQKIEKYARKLKAMGAENVLISMDKNGSLLIDEYDVMHLQGVCEGIVVNSVGAGDSMVAGFVAGIYKGMDYGNTLKLATACGGATAFCKAIANKKQIDECLKQLI